MVLVGLRAAIVGNAASPANPSGIHPLNKPVVVSEEALVAPVLVPDVTSGLAAKAAATGPAYIVLGGISFSHFLNDTMQSLIASVYPILKDKLCARLRADRMITLAFQFTASLLQPVVGHFTDKKAQPFSLAIGMGSTFFGLLLLSVAQQYVDHPDRGRAGRAGLGGVPSGVGADRAARLGRALRFRAIGVSGRRQFRHLDGSGAGGIDRGAVRTAEHRVVFLDRVSRDRHPVADRALVQAADRGKEDCAGRAASGCAELAPRHDRAGRAGRAAVLQAALRVEPVELLHLLPDRQVRASRPRPRSSICSSFSPPTRSAHSSVDRSAIVSAANT